MGETLGVLSWSAKGVFVVTTLFTSMCFQPSISAQELRSGPWAVGTSMCNYM